MHSSLGCRRYLNGDKMPVSRTKDTQLFSFVRLPCRSCLVCMVQCGTITTPRRGLNRPLFPVAAMCGNRSPAFGFREREAALIGEFSANPCAESSPRSKGREYDRKECRGTATKKLHIPPQACFVDAPQIARAVARTRTSASNGRRVPGNGRLPPGARLRANLAPFPLRRPVGRARQNGPLQH